MPGRVGGQAPRSMDREAAERLAGERVGLRQAKDFAAADAIRDRLLEAGWEVADRPGGFELRSVPRPCAVTMMALIHGWPEDAQRWAGSVLDQTGAHDFEALAVLNGADVRLEGVRTEVLPEVVGWAEAANAGIRSAAGDVVVLFDPGVELTGDVAGPLLDALADETVALAGAFGVRCPDGEVGHFHDSQGPEVDALEAYCLAFRRAQAAEAGGFDPKFRFYRIADFDFSFRMRERYGRAVVVPGLPLQKHRHRLWESLGPEDRERRSRKNFYRFLDRWRERRDMLVER